MKISSAWLLLVGVVTLVATTTAARELGINLLDYGCTSNGPACGEQFQAAINASMQQGRTLLVPAGTYNINQTLVIPLGKGPFRMLGEGKYNTHLSATEVMTAVMRVEWNGVDKEGTNVEISELQFNAAANADYGLDAGGLTRSYFNNVYFTSALKSGCRHGGWIDVFNQCSFNGNGIAGLELSAYNNNVVVSSCSFEGNPGMGILIRGGSQVTLQNNVIEGNGNVGVWANAVNGLALRSNYFEYNQEHGALTLPYAEGTPRANNLTFDAAVVLNGDGSVTGQLAGAYPNTGVELSFNTISPHPTARKKGHPVVGFLLAGVKGAVINANRLYPDTAEALVLTVGIDTLVAEDITFDGNVGNTRLLTNTLYPTDIALHRPTTNYASGQYDRWVMSNPPKYLQAAVQVVKPREYSAWSRLTTSGASISTQTLDSTSPVGYVVARDAPGAYRSYNLTTDGLSASSVYGIQFSSASPSLSRTPFVVKASVRCMSEDTVFAFAIQPGANSSWQYSSDWLMSPKDAWMDLSYQAVLEGNGPYNFGVMISSTKKSPTEILMTAMTVAPIGLGTDIQRM